MRVIVPPGKMSCVLSRSHRARSSWIPGAVVAPTEERGIECSDRGADQRVGDDAVLQQALHHADLYAPRGAAGEYEYVVMLSRGS